MKSFWMYVALSTSLIGLVACEGTTTHAQMTAGTQPIKTGAQVLAERNFDLLASQRVGLIANHTAMVDSTHLIDLLYENDAVNLVALFGPEHGLRGLGEAGDHLTDGIDDATGLPVYSLYGKNRKPAPDVLAGLDVLVFDIQDVGARFYTYISTMGLTMQAAAEAGLHFVVLDRPNPIGGTLMEGFVREPEFESFIGQYPIPITHGLTVGELAEMIKGEGWLPGLDSLNLTVVPLEHGMRDVHWPATGLPWIKTSPNIPDYETALIYPGTCLLEGTIATEGRGTLTPFKVVGADWVDSVVMADSLNAQQLPGVRFEPASFVPKTIPGMVSNPKFEGKEIQGVRLSVTDPKAFRPVVTGVYVLHAFYHTVPDTVGFFKTSWMDKLAGTRRLREMLIEGAGPETIIEAWKEEVMAFEEQRAKYLRYAIEH